MSSRDSTARSYCPATSGRRKRTTSPGADRAERWLGPREDPRARPWAYEELLLGANGDGPERGALDDLAAELAVDLAELRRMQDELFDQVVRVAELGGRIRAVRDVGAEEPEPQTEARSEDP